MTPLEHFELACYRAKARLDPRNREGAEVLRLLIEELQRIHKEPRDAPHP